MPLTNVEYVWQFNLAVTVGSGFNTRLNERKRVADLLTSQGFTVIVEPEGRLATFRIRASHRRESAITLFLLNRPVSVESIERIR